MQKIKTALIGILLVLAFSSYGWADSSDSSDSDVDFERLHGSDLGIGIGARAIGLAGAFVSIADDASAIFWNPAGLTQLNDHQIFLSADLPLDFSAAALIYKPASASLSQFDFTLGLGLVNRLSFKADSGNGTWAGYPSHLLDMAMIDVEDDFSGEIDSNTYDLRLSLAMVPPGFKRMSLGVNLIHIS